MGQANAPCDSGSGVRSTLSCKANHLFQLGFTAYRSYGVMFKNHEEFMVPEYWKLAS